MAAGSRCVCNAETLQMTSGLGGRVVCKHMHFPLIVPLLLLSLCVCVLVGMVKARYVLFSLLAVSAGELPYRENRKQLPKHANCYSRGRIN